MTLDGALQPVALPGPAGAATDEDALVAAAISDTGAFAPLYDRYYPRVYRYLAARCSSPEEAADVAQSVFLRAFHALPSYRPGSTPFAAWIFRIARNAATDAHRRRRPILPLSGAAAIPSGPSSDPERAALDRERHDRLRAVVARLPHDKQELLALRFAGELTLRDIAALTGKSEAAVKKQLFRTIAQLKELYRDEFP